MKNSALVVIDLQNDITKNYREIIEIVSVARGLVISGILILLLPALVSASAIWFAMPITELLTAVYAVTAMRRYTAKLQAS